MRLPSFQQLRAFEAAARHENFSRAADELHLTHGAISHQVRALEEELGAPLFVRHGRNVKVTADGLKFCLLYTSPSPRDLSTSRMPSSA